MTHSAERRRVLAWLGASLIATPALADTHPATPRMTEGPFYPTTFPRDTDADLTRVAGRAGAAAGTVLDVSGRVMDRDGRPRAGAKVEIWQCDNQGQYHHVGGWQGAGDENFQGYGVVLTDAEGRYALRTIKPGPIRDALHIHFNVEGASGALPRRCSSRAAETSGWLVPQPGGDALVTMKLQGAAGRLKGSRHRRRLGGFGGLAQVERYRKRGLRPSFCTFIGPGVSHSHEARLAAPRPERVHRECRVVASSRWVTRWVHPPSERLFQRSTRSNTSGAWMPMVGCNAEGGAHAR